MSEAIGQLTLTLPCKPAEEVIVEVFGLYQNDKQKLALYQDDKKLTELLLKEQKAQTCIFSTQNACEYELEKCYLALEIQGEQGPLVVPLSAPGSVKTTQYQAKRQINLINSVLPATPMPTSDNEELLVPCREGYLYLFHQGKLWREVQLLTPDNQWLFKDVDVAHWRQSSAENKDLRQPVAECDALWFPNALAENDYADLCIAYSEVQWSWERIQYLEANPEAITQRCQPLSPSIYTWFDKGGEDFVRDFSELEDVRPRCEDAELMFSQPEELMRDLSGAILGQRAKQTIKHTELNNKFQALEPSFYLRQLVTETDKAQQQAPQELSPLPQVDAVSSAWQQGKDYKLAALILEDPIFNTRYHSRQFQDINACLSQLNLLSVAQPHSAAAKLLNTHILTARFADGEVNPRHKLAKAMDTEDTGKLNQTLFISARRVLRDKASLHTQSLKSLLENKQVGAYLYQLGDYFSLTGADYSAGFMEIANLSGAMLCSPEQSDGLLREDEDKNWLLGNVTAFSRLMDNGLENMLWGTQDTPEGEPGSGGFNPERFSHVHLADWEGWQNARTPQGVLLGALHQQVEQIKAQDTEFSLGGNDWMGLMRASSNGTSGVMDSIVAIYLLSLKQEFGSTHTYAVKLNKLYGLQRFYNHGMFKNLGLKLILKKGGFKGSEDLSFLDIVKKSELGDDVEIVDGHVAGKRLQLQHMGDTIASPSKQALISGKASLWAEDSYAMFKSAALDAEVANTKRGATQKAWQWLTSKPYRLPGIIAVFDIWNLDQAILLYRNEGSGYSKVNALSAVIDLLLSSAALVNLSRPNTALARVMNHPVPIPTIAMTEAGKRVYASLALQRLAGMAAGVLTTAVQAWNGFRLLNKADNDAATAQFIQAGGTALATLGPLAAVVLGLPVLTPIAIVAGLALIIGGAIGIAYFTDSRLERWLKAGPFRRENSQHKEDLDDELTALHALMFVLFDGERRRLDIYGKVQDSDWQQLDLPPRKGTFSLVKLKSPLLNLADIEDSQAVPELVFEQTLNQGFYNQQLQEYTGFAPIKVMTTSLLQAKWVSTASGVEYWWLYQGEGLDPYNPEFRVETRAFSRARLALSEDLLGEKHVLHFPTPDPEDDWGLKKIEKPLEEKDPAQIKWWWSC